MPKQATLDAYLPTDRVKIQAMKITFPCQRWADTMTTDEKIQFDEERKREYDNRI